MEYVTLNNGEKMPMIGFGVFQIPESKEAERAVSDALEVGYRMIDTAASYFNEEAVGAAIKSNGIPRDELFVTTKLWVQDYGYDNTLKAFDVSMKKLGLDVLDLYLMHKPYGDYYVDCQHFFRQLFLGYFACIVQGSDIPKRNVSCDGYTSSHNPIT